MTDQDDKPKFRLPPEPTKPKLPSRWQLVSLCLDTVFVEAMGKQLTYVNKKGEVKSKPDPNFKGAVEAVKVAGQLCGYVGGSASAAARVAAAADAEADKETTEDAEAAIAQIQKRIMARRSQED